MKGLYFGFLVAACCKVSNACELSLYPPVLRQIDEDVVFVDWVETATEVIGITEFEVKYWPAGSPSYSKTLGIEDMDINFDYVSVEKGRIYCYQLIVEIFGNDTIYLIFQNCFGSNFC